MSGAITPILNLVLEGDADAKGHKILNLDLSGLASGAPFFDNTALIRGNVDGTKLAHFDLSLIGSAQHRVFQLPNYNGRLATVAGTEDLTNKTVNGITLTGDGGIHLNAGILNIDGELSTEGNIFFLNANNDVTIRAGVATDVTLPASGTLATTSQLPVISDVAYDATTWNGNTDGATKNALRDKFESLVSAPFSDSTAIVKGSADQTKQLKIEVDGFTSSTIRTLTAPNKNGVIACMDDVPDVAGILFSADQIDRQLYLAGNAAFFGSFTLAGGFLTILNVTAGTELTLPTEGTLATLAGAETLTNKTIVGGSATLLNEFSIQPEGLVYPLKIVPGTSGFTSARTLSLNIPNANTSLTLGGNFSTAGALTFAGAYAATLNFLGATTISFPTTGLLATIVSPPATDGATGTAGQISYDSGFFYVCYSANSWGRIALDTSFP